MTRILIPRASGGSAKVVASTDFEKYFCPLLTDHVICGYTIAVQCPNVLAVDIASGNARVLGLHVNNSTSCSIMCLTVCDTNSIYIQVNRDVCCRPCNFTFTSNTTGTTATDSFKIGTATTNCATVTAVTTIGTAAEITMASGTAFPLEFALNRLFWRTDENRLYKNTNTEASPTFSLTSSSWSVLGDYEAACAEASHTFCFTAVDFNDDSKLVLVIDGATTAAATLQMRINADATANYFTDGRRIAADTETLIDLNDQNEIEILNTAILDAARPFNGNVEIGLNKASAAQLTSFVNSIMAGGSSSGPGQQVVTGNLNISPTASITDIEVRLSTSTWRIGTRITLYKVSRTT